MALHKLAIADDICTISWDIMATLGNVQATANSQKVKVILDTIISTVDWKEGIEELIQPTNEQLQQMLGLSHKQLLFFPQWTDPDTMIDPLDAAGQRFLQNTTSSQKPCFERAITVYAILG